MNIEIATVVGFVCDTRLCAEHVYVAHHTHERLTGGRVPTVDVVSAFKLIRAHGRFELRRHPDWRSLEQKLLPCDRASGRNAGELFTVVCNPNLRSDLTSALHLTTPHEWCRLHTSDEKEDHLDAVARCMLAAKRPIAEIGAFALRHPTFYPLCAGRAKRITKPRDVRAAGFELEDVAQRLWLRARRWFETHDTWEYDPDTRFAKFLNGVVIDLCARDVVKDIGRAMGFKDTPPATAADESGAAAEREGHLGHAAATAGGNDSARRPEQPSPADGLTLGERQALYDAIDSKSSREASRLIRVHESDDRPEVRRIVKLLKAHLKKWTADATSE